MALIKDITLDSGINLPESYIKIISCNYINGYHVIINVAIFKDKSSRVDRKQEVVKFKHPCTETNQFNDYFSLDVLNEVNKNIISQAYLWLKTLPFYNSAIDDMDLKE